MYNFLLDLALILLSTKALGLLTKRFSMPQVVGALLAGLILGPGMLNILTETSFIGELSEIGVIILMFSAGVETDIKELKKTGVASIVIAVLGVIIPAIGGFIVAYFFNGSGMMESDAQSPILLQNIFIGVVLTATSVSITVETLKEMGKLSTKAGNAILGAAIIDDILGIIALTVITGLADSSVHIGDILIKMLLFFVFSAIVGIIFHRIYEKWTSSSDKDLRRFVVAAFVFCLLMAYIAEVAFGVADITGAFIAGLIISNTKRTSYIEARFSTLSYLMLSPIFFASIGIKVQLPPMSKEIIAFAVLLVLIAIITKIIGCGLGAKICGFTNREAFQIGSGMISRGEVALIVASKGAAEGLLGSNFLGPIVIMAFGRPYRQAANSIWVGKRAFPV